MDFLQQVLFVTLSLWIMSLFQVGDGSECIRNICVHWQPQPTWHAGVGQRLFASHLHQDRAALFRWGAAFPSWVDFRQTPTRTNPWREVVCLCFCRGSVLSVHGHVVSRLHPSEEGQISSQAGARIYTQLQSSSGGFQKDERRQSQKPFFSPITYHIFIMHFALYFWSSLIW